MSTPSLLTSKEILETVKEKIMASEENITIVQQIKFDSPKSGLPSLKVKSWVFYKENGNDSLKVIQTDGLDFKKLEQKELDELKFLLNKEILIEQLNNTSYNKSNHKIKF